MLKSICLIGAGNIGSRHLQALAKVTQPLLIQVVDPSQQSLDLAKKRYEEVKTLRSKHQVHYLQSLNNIIPQIDIAIIATSSNSRSAVTKKLFDKSSIKYLVFEKILFDHHDQYEEMKKLLVQKQCKAWVDCSMRTDPFYSGLKKHLENLPIIYLVHGSNHGLITNAIHYIDHMAYLTDCYNFTIDTTRLDSETIKSKRKGFLEINGTLNTHFKDGSYGSFICYPSGNAPFTIEVLSEKYRCLMKPLENKILISDPKSNWAWKLQTVTFLYQSQMTNRVVISLLKSGSCELTPFNVSAKMHLDLLEPLRKFLNSNSKKKFISYPFT